MTTLRIPDEAVETAARALARRDGHDPDEQWQEFDRSAHHSAAAIGEDYDDPMIVRWTLYVDKARAALTAALPLILGEPVTYQYLGTSLFGRFPTPEWKPEIDHVLAARNGFEVRPLYHIPTEDSSDE